MNRSQRNNVNLASKWLWTKSYKISLKLPLFSKYKSIEFDFTQNKTIVRTDIFYLYNKVSQTWNIVCFTVIKYTKLLVELHWSNTVYKQIEQSQFCLSWERQHFHWACLGLIRFIKTNKEELKWILVSCWMLRYFPLVSFVWSAIWI